MLIFFADDLRLLGGLNFNVDQALKRRLIVCFPSSACSYLFVANEVSRERPGEFFLFDSCVSSIAYLVLMHRHFERIAGDIYLYTIQYTK